MIKDSVRCPHFMAPCSTTNNIKKVIKKVILPILYFLETVSKNMISLTQQNDSIYRHSKMSFTNFFKSLIVYQYLSTQKVTLNTHYMLSIL